MEEYITLVSVPTITVLVYWIINLIKYAFDGNEKLKRFIPIMAAGLGLVLGVVAFYAAPEMGVGKNPFVAAIVGMASGLAATGANQVIKQLSKKDCEELLKEDKKEEGTGDKDKKDN